MSFGTRTLLTLAGVLAIAAACGDDDAPSPTPTAAATLPPGDIPAGVRDFASTLDRALTLGGVDLVKLTSYGSWSCPNNYYPAPGPNCTEAAEGEGVAAVDIGAYGSEGDIYDAVSYGRFLYNWIYDALRDRADEYGTGAPRVYALADMPEEFEGEQGSLGTYEIIATRFAAFADRTSQREVLAFYVTGMQEGWLITRLQRIPLDFLDPASEEARSVLTSWQPWDEPAPGGELASRWHPLVADRKVAYLDTDNALHVATADASEDTVIADRVCKASEPTKEPLGSWSPDAHRIAVHCGIGTPGGRPFLEIYAVVGDGGPWTIENVAWWYWAPVGNRVVYQTGERLTAIDVNVVRMADLDSGEDTLVHDDAVLRAWPRQDQLLLGLNPGPPTTDVAPQTFDAYWYDLTTGATERIERFDTWAQFWICAPNTGKAIVLNRDALRKSGGVTLAVYDLATGEETPLTGLFIAYPSEGIPVRMVQPHPYSEHFVWADVDEGPGVAISQALLDGSNATFLDRVPGLLIDDLSPDGLVLYGSVDKAMTLRDTHTGAETTWENAVSGAISPIVGGRS